MSKIRTFPSSRTKATSERTYTFDRKQFGVITPNTWFGNNLEIILELVIKEQSLFNVH